MSRLLVFQSLWATEVRIPGVAERPVEERFDQVRNAGFDGMSIDLGALSLEQARAVVPQYRRTGLRGLVTAFPRTIEDIRPAIHLAKDIGSPFLVVVGQIMPLTVGDMIAAIHGWQAVARQEGMPLHFETHRDSITNDLFSTVQLLDAIPDMTLSADLSHYVVDREVSLPVTDRYRALFSQILARSESFQGRIATGQHIQVPLDFPQHKAWVDLFAGWWTQGFAQWRSRAHKEDDLVFLCELGPSEYAMTDRHGLELSDRWQEALQLRIIAKRCWEDTETGT